MSSIDSVTSTPLPTVDHDRSKVLGTMESAGTRWELFLYYVDDEGNQVDLPDSFEEGTLAKAQALSRTLIDAHIRHHTIDLAGKTMIQIDDLGLSFAGNSTFTHDFELNEAENTSFKAIIRNTSSTVFKANDVWLEIIRMTGGVLPGNASNHTRLGMRHATPDTPDTPHTPPHQNQTNPIIDEDDPLHPPIDDALGHPHPQHPETHTPNLSDQAFYNQFGRYPIHLY